MKTLRITLLLLLLVIFTASSAQAQTYLFNLSELHVNVYLNQDGTASIDYAFTFVNNPSASPIEYVDVGLPNSNYNLNDVVAEVNGNPISVSSDYQGSGGIGFAAALGSRAIPPGGSGTVHVFVPNVGPWLRFDDTDKNYASFVFATTYFGSKYVEGSTNTSVTIHLPPGVQPGEPRWHAAPSGFSSEPVTALDDAGACHVYLDQLTGQRLGSLRVWRFLSRPIRTCLCHQIGISMGSLGDLSGPGFYLLVLRRHLRLDHRGQLAGQFGFQETQAAIPAA